MPLTYVAESRTTAKPTVPTATSPARAIQTGSSGVSRGDPSGVEHRRVECRRVVHGSVVGERLVENARDERRLVAPSEANDRQELHEDTMPQTISQRQSSQHVSGACVRCRHCMSYDRLKHARNAGRRTWDEVRAVGRRDVRCRAGRCLDVYRRGRGAGRRAREIGGRVVPRTREAAVVPALRISRSHPIDAMIACRTPWPARVDPSISLR